MHVSLGPSKSDGDKSFLLGNPVASERWLCYILDTGPARKPIDNGDHVLFNELYLQCTNVEYCVVT